jgi:5-hydroxyisourate hydrolase-like protein (transthyretin family)
MRWRMVVPLLAALSASASGFEINGRVVDARTGDPLESVQVDLSIPLDDWKKAATVKTESGGRFHFEGLAPAKYAVAAEKRGYPHQFLDEHEGFSTNVAVGPDLAPVDVVFRLHRDARISGRVTDDQNDPVREAEVYLFCTCAKHGRITTHLDDQVTTDARGVYRFSHKEPGKYLVAVSATPWYAQTTPASAADRSEASPLDVVFPLTFYGGSTEPAAADPIVLSWGDSKTADVILHAVPALHLRVVTAAKGQDADPKKEGIEANFTRRLFGTDIPLNGQTAVDETGTIDVGGLAPGRYEMTVEIDGETQKLFQKTVDIASNAEIRGTDGNRELVVLTGKVQQNGEDLTPGDDGVTVLLHDAAGNEWSTEVNPDGSFAFDYRSSPGKYHVDVSGGGLFLKSVEGTGASGLTVEIGREPVELTLAVEEAQGTIEGVALRDGKPESGVMIVLVPESRSVGLYRRDQSDSDGTFALTKVAPGEYIAVAFESWEVAWQDPEVLKRALPHGALVTVAGDGKYKVLVKIQ